MNSRLLPRVVRNINHLIYFIVRANRLEKNSFGPFVLYEFKHDSQIITRTTRPSPRKITF